MVFAEKLKFIMQLTSTTNSRLAAAINVDPSLISRLKSGARSVSTKSDYLSSMAEYFGSKCNDSFRSLTMIEILGADFGDDLVFALEKWFLDEEAEIDSAHAKNAFIQNGTQSVKSKRVKQSFVYFHGKNAPAEAAEYVMELAKEESGIKKIKLFSDCTDILGGFDLFECCKDSITKLAEKGTEIVRVMPNYSDFGRAVNDVFSCISLLDSGKLKSYYYQGLRDRLFHNSLMVVPGVAAMFSDSVGVGGVVPTVVTTEKAAVSDFERMFDEYITFCTKGIKSEHNSDFNSTLSKFLEKKEDCCQVFDTLPFEWTPKEFFYDENEIFFLNKAAQSVRELLKTNTVTEIFPLFSPNEIENGKVKCFTGTSNKRFYTSEQYLEHLAVILDLLENEPNYNAVPMLFNEDFRENILIKKGFEAIRLPKNEDGTVGIIEHPSSVCALWQYFMNDMSVNRIGCRKQTIKEIKELIGKLRK